MRLKKYPGMSRVLETDDIHHTSDRALLDELPRAHRAFDVQPLGKIDRVFALRRRDFRARGIELRERGERSFVGEIILAGIHHARPERPASARHRRAGHELDFRFLQHRIETRQRLRVWKNTAEFFDLRRIGIEDVSQFTTRLSEPLALAVNVAVIERGGGENKFTGFDHRCGFALGGVVHSVGFLHGARR